MEIFEKLLKRFWRHVYICNSQEFHLCYPNCLRLVLAQSRSLSLPKLCVISYRTLNLGQTFTKALCHNLGGCRKIFGIVFEEVSGRKLGRKLHKEWQPTLWLSRSLSLSIFPACPGLNSVAWFCEILPLKFGTGTYWNSWGKVSTLIWPQN